jgi:phosphoribosylglycinamide formyltransferase-1
MLRLGFLVSGGGTNLQAIIDKKESGYLDKCELAVVISSKPGVYALERAEKYGIPSICVPRKSFDNIDDYDKALIEQFERYSADLIVFAGFNVLLGERFNNRYKGKMINVHPALIPSFCGKGFYGLATHEKVLEYGVKITGATVHFIELEADSGPIIIQKPVYVRDDDTPETLQKRVMEEAEWEILPEAIKLISEGRVVVDGRKVRITECKE